MIPKEKVGTGNFHKCWQTFNDITVDSDFTKEMFRTSNIRMKDVPSSTVQKFFEAAYRRKVLIKDGKQYTKVLDFSFKEAVAELMKFYEARMERKKKRMAAVQPIEEPTPAETKDMEEIPTDSMVVLPAETYNKMKKGLIHQDWVIQQRNNEVASLKKNITDLIDENRTLQAELRSRTRVVKADTTFLDKILPTIS